MEGIKLRVEIKHKYTDAVLFYSDTAENIRQALIQAVSTGANLTRASLTGANLTGANLTGASLIGAYLTGANLTGANLTRASLIGANLTGANLTRASLTGASLTGASLTGASLTGASLTGANLTGANLTGANLIGASLIGAYLTGASLIGAYLTGASLIGAYLTRANLPNFQLVPSHGSFVGWKKLSNNSIVKLGISRNAKRTSSLVGRKCRAEYAKVLAIFGEPGYSKHDDSFLYRVGKIVRPDSFDDDIRVECTHGIHFFVTREEAEAY